MISSYRRFAYYVKTGEEEQRSELSSIDAAASTPTEAPPSNGPDVEALSGDIMIPDPSNIDEN